LKRIAVAAPRVIVEKDRDFSRKYLSSAATNANIAISGKAGFVAIRGLLGKGWPIDHGDHGDQGRDPKYLVEH